MHCDQPRDKVIGLLYTTNVAFGATFGKVIGFQLSAITWFPLLDEVICLLYYKRSIWGRLWDKIDGCLDF